MTNDEVEVVARAICDDWESLDDMARPVALMYAKAAIAALDAHRAERKLSEGLRETVEERASKLFRMAYPEQKP